MDQPEAHKQLLHAADELGDCLVRLSQTRADIRDDKRLAELTERLHDAVVTSKGQLFP